jgi:tight adherence protein C
MLLLLFLSFACTMALLGYALLWRPPSPVQARARALGHDGHVVQRPVDDPFSTRVMVPVARGVANTLLKLLPTHWMRRLERMLIAAGEPIDLGLFVLLWALVTVASSAGAAVWLGPRAMLLFGVLGLVLPFLWLRRTMRRRQRRIRNDLPDSIDLLVTCVEAGLGLDAALMRVAEAAEGPLGEEITIALRQIAVGRPRQEALLEFGARPNVPDLDGFIRPIVQAERSGVSIGQTLRVQAESMRIRRQQRAQEMAQTMPVKLTVVLPLFIIAVLLIGIGPAILSFADLVSELGGG